jgi:hypothetical protein
MNFNIRRNSPVILSAFFLLILIGISSCAGRSAVLVPVEKPKEVKGADSVDSGPYQRLAEILASHKYQGVGLQYESTETQELLIKVFSDPRTTNRKIQLIYTGLGMGYDPKFKSLTVGMGEAESMIKFIQTKVPPR